MSVSKILTENRLDQMIVNASKCMDTRLIDHGERVAFVLYKLLTYQGKYTVEEIRRQCLIALLHDIGAYKTEEIENMIRFEHQDIWEHSIYGYLFIKEFSPLKKYADAVLCHHMSRGERAESTCANQELAALIHMIDGMDSGIKFGMQSIKKWLVGEQVENRFGKEYVQLLLEVDEKQDFVYKLRNGTYRGEWRDIVKEWHFERKDMEGFMKMLIYFIDFRSQNTVTHTITTVSIATCIGELLGYTEEELHKLYWGASFHDLGKIATPLEILEKNGKLTEEEREIMEAHVTATEVILKGSVEEEVLQIAIRHHEKLDGTGYPYGIEGAALTTSERIVAVADVVSALSMKRSYKEAFDKVRILDILEKDKIGNKLCPVIVDIVSENYDHIMQKVKVDCQQVLEKYKAFRQTYDTMMQAGR